MLGTTCLVRDLDKDRRTSGEWCARVESNHHSFRNTDLNRARLPIPPRARSEAFPERPEISLAPSGVNGDAPAGASRHRLDHDLDPVFDSLSRVFEGGRQLRERKGV